jgi:hypothetical protein
VRRPLIPLCAAVLAAVAVGAASPASAGADGRAGGTGLAPRAEDLRQVSPADRRDWRRAIAIAERTESVREQRERRPALHSRSFAREGACCMTVWFYADGDNRAVVKLDLRTGRIVEQWQSWQANWEMARGYEGDLGHIFNSPFILVPLGLLFLAPFVDPRRPLRMLHLDLLVLLGFGVSHVVFNRGEIGWSVPLVYPVLAYLLIRMLAIGFRPGRARGPLVPLVPVTWLIAGTVALFGARVVMNLVDSNVLDVGYAGVIGANHIANGDELYDGRFAADPPAGDTYGPVTYLTYLPFERLIGWSGEWDAVPAAHGAAIFFDLLTAAALFLLGRRLRAGPASTALGAALAFAWEAYPYSLFALMTNSNDALVAALVVLALVALRTAPARGLFVGLGAAAKLAPGALAPLFVNPSGRPGAREPLLYAGVFALVLVASIAPFLPPGGVQQFYDHTLGFQLGRESPFSVWGQEPSLEWLQTALKLVAVNLAVVVLLFPARKEPVQVAALAAAILIAFQLPAVHWFYLYVVWFAPLVLVALFALHESVHPRAAGA